MEFINKLKHLRITKAYIKNGRINVELDGYALPSKHVKITGHCKWVGSHRNGAGKRIFIDDDIEDEKHKLCIAAHEAVENWMWKTFFPDETNAESYPKVHAITQHIEHKWIRSRFGEKFLRDYEKKVDEVFDKENS